MSIMRAKNSGYLAIVLIVISSLQGCNEGNTIKTTVQRFEKDLFVTFGDSDSTYVSNLKNKYHDFFPLFCTDIIRIGPDTARSALVQLRQFKNDPVVKQVSEMADSVYGNFNPYSEKIRAGIKRFGEKTGTTGNIEIITFIGGFNQSFIALPGTLAVGIDNYLGAETGFYKQLAIPRYLRQNMDPEYLAADAVRAWITSELARPGGNSTLLENMIYEGMVLYYLKNSLPRLEEHKIFRYTQQQLEWCEQFEKSMWRYILENELLYSTDRMIISRMTKEGPFVREFGQDSPGRAGSWLGYRIFENYMKKAGKKTNWPLEIEDSRKVLSESRYRPG